MSAKRLAIRAESSRDGLVRIRMDRPPVNVLGSDDLRALAAAVADASASGARVILLAGLPRAFSAGVRRRGVEKIMRFRRLSTTDSRPPTTSSSS